MKYEITTLSNGNISIQPMHYTTDTPCFLDMPSNLLEEAKSYIKKLYPTVEFIQG